MILELTLNVALVVALGVLIQAAERQWGLGTFASRVAAGILFAAVTLVAMMTPVVLAPGLIFDARSIILCTAGVIGGPIVAVIAAVFATAYRVYLGGVGTAMGVSVIIESAVLGSAFYYLRMRDKRFESVYWLYGLGLLVHVIMIGLVFLLPPEQRGQVIRQIALPVLVLYPMATVAVCKLLLDNEERLREREALDESELRYRALIDASPVPYAVIDGEEHGLLLNDAFVRTFGYTLEDTPSLADWWVKAYPDPEYRQQLTVAWRERLEKAKAEEWSRFEPLEARVVCKDGSQRTVLVSGAELTGALDGRLIVVLYDITDREQAELAARESQEQLRATVEQAAVGIARVGLDGTWLDANDRMCEILGYTKEELLSLTFADVTHPDEAGRDVEALQRLKRGESSGYGVEKRYLTKEGSVIWADIAVTAARGPDGMPQYMVTVVQDVTDRKRAEDSLFRSTRALRALSGVNEALVRAHSEDDLLKGVCDAVVSDGDYLFAWVGYVEYDEAKTVTPMRVCGDNVERIAALGITWGEGPTGQGPIGRSIRACEPVVMRSVDTESTVPTLNHAAIARGFSSVMSLPLLEPDGSALGILAIYSIDPEAFSADEVELLSRLAEDLSFGIETLRARERRAQADADLVASNERLEGVLRSVTETLGRVVEVRDPYTQGHEQGVARLTRLIAGEMGLPEDEIEGIEVAALVHDVGKLSVPAEILTKPGRLSDTEFALIKTHSQAGYDILKDIDFDWPVADIVLQHHERMDGSGYPSGLSGDDILFAARVLMVADVIEAMAAHRPYRPALGLEAAMAEIAGHPEKFDGQVISACERLYAAGKIEL